MTETKTIRDSEVIMTDIVLPQDTNAYGNFFGGAALAMIDKAAAICAHRHCRTPVVTVAMDRIEFSSPIKKGDFVTVRARMAFCGKSSMIIKVKVEAETPETGVVIQPIEATVTFVAIKKHPLGHSGPCRVPQLDLERDEEALRIFEEEKRIYEKRKLNSKNNT